MQPLPSKAEQYLKGRWQQQRDYYSRQSARNKRWYQSLLLFSTVALLPTSTRNPQRRAGPL